MVLRSAGREAGSLSTLVKLDREGHQSSSEVVSLEQAYVQMLSWKDAAHVLW